MPLAPFVWISGANTPRKSDQGKTVAIILAQVDGKVRKRYTRSLRPHYVRSTVALDSIEINSKYSVSIGQ